MNKHIIIGTAGHVDHGKTALIKRLTGIDCDTHKEEKQRGITINPGFSHLDLPSGTSVGIVDVSGHKDFIKNMVAGAFGVDMVLLVIAMDAGIMPQTLEHLNIIKMLGVKNTIIVITKADLADNEMIELAKLEVMEFVEKYDIENPPVVSVSSVTGQGIDELIEEIEQMIPEIKEKDHGDVFRMYIDRYFNKKGHGVVVTGSIISGKLNINDNVFILPGNSEPVKVKNIQRHGKTVAKVYGGDRAAINIPGIKLNSLQKGLLLCNRKLKPSFMVDAKLYLFPGKNTYLKLWSTVLFYTGTFYTTARVHLLDKDKLGGGEEALVQIHLTEGAILMPKDKFIIRNTSGDLTLGGGIVLDTNPLHHRRRTVKMIQLVKKINDAIESDEKLINFIEIELLKKATPVSIENLAESIGTSSENLAKKLGENNSSRVQCIEDSGKMFLWHRDHMERFKKELSSIIDQYHRDNPLLSKGLSMDELISKMKLDIGYSRLFTKILVNELLDEQIIQKAGNTYILHGFKPKIGKNTRQQMEKIEKAIKEHGVDKLDFGTLVEKAGTGSIEKKKLEQILHLLVNQGKITLLPGMPVHNKNLDKIRSRLLKVLKEEKAGINEKQFRELIDTGKKVAQILLDNFIREGIVKKEGFYIHITPKGKGAIR